MNGSVQRQVYMFHSWPTAFRRGQEFCVMRASRILAGRACDFTRLYALPRLGYVGGRAFDSRRTNGHAS